MNKKNFNILTALRGVLIDYAGKMVMFTTPQEVYDICVTYIAVRLGIEPKVFEKKIHDL